MIKKLDGANVYITEDYSYKSQIIKDLEDAVRVVVISTKEDVVSFYGLLLEQYGQYNVYLEEDLSVVDDDYLDEVSNRDRSKEEAIIFIGTSLSDMISETIDELHLNDKQKRIMNLCKEVIKGTDDTKSKAIISKLNEKLTRANANIGQLEEELEQYKANKANFSGDEIIYMTTMNLDTILSHTRVMYVREYSKIPYINTLLEMYVLYLDKICKKRVKMVIIDNKLDYDYVNRSKINTVDEYVSARQKYRLENIVVTRNVIPPFITDLYKQDTYDLIIILDRNILSNDVVKGKNVANFSSINSTGNLDYCLKNKKDQTFILDKHLNYDDGIIIPSIPELKEPNLKDDEKLYYFVRAKNEGREKKVIFEMLNEINKIKK